VRDFRDTACNFASPKRLAPRLSDSGQVAPHARKPSLSTCPLPDTARRPRAFSYSFANNNLRSQIGPSDHRFFTVAHALRFSHLRLLSSPPW